MWHRNKVILTDAPGSAAVTALLDAADVVITSSPDRAAALGLATSPDGLPGGGVAARADPPAHAALHRRRRRPRRGRRVAGFGGRHGAAAVLVRRRPGRVRLSVPELRAGRVGCGDGHRRPDRARAIGPRPGRRRGRNAWRAGGHDAVARHRSERARRVHGRRPGRREPDVLHLSLLRRALAVPRRADREVPDRSTPHARHPRSARRPAHRPPAGRLVLPDNRGWVRERIAAAFDRRPREEWLAQLSEADCPAGPVDSRDDWLAHEQIVALGQRRTVDDPVVGATVMPWVPVELAATPARDPRPRRLAAPAAWSQRPQHPQRTRGGSGSGRRPPPQGGGGAFPAARWPASGCSTSARSWPACTPAR